MLYAGETVIPHEYSVRDDDSIVHDVIPHPDDLTRAVANCAMWRHLRVHSHLGMRRPAAEQPVTCLFCLSNSYVIDMPQFNAFP
jgi:hypothetical protein